MTSDVEITGEEFARRFADELVRLVGPDHRDEDGDLHSTRGYALEVAPTYFEDADQRAEGPEECARTDFSYWEG